MSPAQLFRKLFAHLLLGEPQMPRQAKGYVQKTVIDGLYLHRHFSAVRRLLAAPVAGHASHSIPLPT